jgi:hypothetical protein
MTECRFEEILQVIDFRAAQYLSNDRDSSGERPRFLSARRVEFKACSALLRLWVGVLIRLFRSHPSLLCLLVSYYGDRFQIALPPIPVRVCGDLDAIRYALEMDPEERSARMRRKRKIVKEGNIYRWAGNLIGISVRFVSRSRPIRER